MVQKTDWYRDAVVYQIYPLSFMDANNDGYGDMHSMPGDGDVDWDAVLTKLRTCPRMLEWQTEVNYHDGTNWAGELLAPPGGYSIKRIVETFRRLGF